LTKKFEAFKDVSIDDANIEKYIHVVKNNNNNTEYVRIVIDKKRITTFVGKHEPIDEIKKRARNFILNLKDWQRDQIAGNSLEPSLPLIYGNTYEELG
jgi:hypothetical protein